MSQDDDRSRLLRAATQREPARVGEILAGLAGIVIDDDSLQQALHRAVTLAVEVVQQCDAAGVTVVAGRDAATAAYTDERTLPIDRGQYEAGEGPCLEAVRTGRRQRAGLPEAARRWPAFARTAELAGVRSFLAAPLPGPEGSVGALNLYAARPQAFGDVDEQLVGVLADRTGDLVAAYLRTARADRLAAQLQEAMRSRAVIEQAKGVLMARHGVDDGTAFDLLRQDSQHRNVKLRDLARVLVAEAGSGGGRTPAPRDGRHLDEEPRPT